jgi:hypothetical protein
MTGLLLFGSFYAGLSFFHNYLCGSRAVLMGAVIRVQILFWWAGMWVVPWGKRGFFLRMMGRMRMGVVQGVVFILFRMSIFVKACL